MRIYHRQYRFLVMTVAVLVVLASGRFMAVADNTMSRTADPAEHALLMQMADLMRHTDADKVARFLQQHPGSRCAPMLKTKLAYDKLKKKDYDACKAISQQVITDYGEADPLAVTWSQQYLVRSLWAQKKFTEAARKCFEAINAANKPEDLTALLGTQRALGMMCRHKISPTSLSNIAAHYANPDALVLMARCIQKAELGDLAGAQTDFDTLATTLPAGDLRLALTGTCMIMSVSYGCNQEPDTFRELLPRCESIVGAIEQKCPNQRWLTARAKLSFGDAMMGTKISLTKAEQYLRAAAGEGSVTDLLPEANAQLALCLFYQGRHNDAAQISGAITDSYPYSTWADFAAYMRADCLLLAGDKDQAFSLWHELVQQYPESGWAYVARMMMGEVPSR